MHRALLTYPGAYILGQKLLLPMCCVKLGEKNCIHLPSVGEQTANKLPNFTQPMGSNDFGPSTFRSFIAGYGKKRNEKEVPFVQARLTPVIVYLFYFAPLVRLRGRHFLHLQVEHWIFSEYHPQLTSLRL